MLPSISSGGLISRTYMRCSAVTFSPMKTAALGSFQAMVTSLRRELSVETKEDSFVSRTLGEIEALNKHTLISDKDLL